ncbi:uncharacterized protein SETTUDRAFT_179124 [Exserohilum turcica Et28A]|uniref:Uncharacterized protein n=1 Tax=Exserohilum turcicum (strain 28A) TaxID=671987 RepID=R0KD84_EXST2|nr:uncharacterized protein SETTUDRAFT_179124 [Exserohilum turcica Et28A]EOA87349.1 hypothetical protein SETTUDRAFT_179124 [Exserohilum turcica Et28A]
MRSTVLQATAINTIGLVCHHYAAYGLLDKLQENETFLTFSRLYYESTSVQAANEQNQGPLNQTMGHTTNATAPVPNDAPESFYGQELPRGVMMVFLLSILQYWWFIALERLLPARPRNRGMPQYHTSSSSSSSQEPTAAAAAEVEFEEMPDREEKVVQKWIAQGRVRRASLNWCNTLLKWMLDMSVGSLWYHVAREMLMELLRLRSPVRVFRELKISLVLYYASVCFSITPLAHLTAFVVVPAHKQLVFTQGVELLAAMFFYTVFRVFAMWAVETQVIQVFMKNVTAEAERDPKRFGLEGREL